MPVDQKSNEKESVLADGAVFYAVSAKKFLLLSITSFGLFEVYWMYRNWKYERKAFGRHISPFWRSVFAPIYVYPLLGEISWLSKTKLGFDRSLPAGIMATIWILINVAGRLPDPWGLVIILRPFILLPALAYVKELNKLQG